MMSLHRRGERAQTVLDGELWDFFSCSKFSMASINVSKQASRDVFYVYGKLVFYQTLLSVLMALRLQTVFHAEAQEWQGHKGSVSDFMKHPPYTDSRTRDICTEEIQYMMHTGALWGSL